MTGTADREKAQPAHRGMISLWPVILSTLAAGCFEPETGAEITEPGVEPPAGLFGADGGVNTGCTGGDPSPLSKLHVVVRTSQFGGRYRPRNVGAIWIETATGTFVKTIEKWGASRSRYIVKWNASSHGNVVDAVTSATLQSHVTHDRTWNLTDVTHCEIPTGDYRVAIEHTDFDGAGAYTTIPFTKDQTGQLQMPADQTYFHDLVIDLE